MSPVTLAFDKVNDTVTLAFNQVTVTLAFD